MNPTMRLQFLLPLQPLHQTMITELLLRFTHNRPGLIQLPQSVQLLVERNELFTNLVHLSFILPPFFFIFIFSSEKFECKVMTDTPDE